MLATLGERGRIMQNRAGTQAPSAHVCTKVVNEYIEGLQLSTLIKYPHLNTLTLTLHTLATS